MRRDADEDLDVEGDGEPELARGEDVLVGRVDVHFLRRLEDEGEEGEGDPAPADVFVQISDSVRFVARFGGDPGVALFVRDLQATSPRLGRSREVEGQRRALTEQHQTQTCASPPE